MDELNARRAELRGLAAFRPSILHRGSISAFISAPESNYTHFQLTLTPAHFFSSRFSGSDVAA